MKKTITLLKFIVLAPIYIWLFIADRIIMIFYPIDNQWHQNVATKYPNWWVVLLSFYRIAFAMIIFLIYKMTHYVFFS